MNIKRLVTITVSIALLLGLWSCSEDSATGTGTSGRTTIGVITGFGSVFVAGREHQTDQATITMDGQTATESDLAVGMPVALHSTQEGTVTSISTGNEIEGIVLANNIATDGSLNVMGLVVSVDTNTLFESDVTAVNSVESIEAGNIVEVYGYPGDSGRIFATRLEVVAASLSEFLLTHPEGVEVKANLTGLDEMSMRFMIGTMPVDYSNAIVDADSALADDMLVEVKSTLGLDNGVLLASKVDPATHSLHSSDAEEFETQAIITRDYDGTRFSIAGFNILVVEETNLENNTMTSDLVAGTLVKVEGVFNAEGDVVADKVVLENEVTDEFEGVVDMIETTDTNTGTVTMVSGRSFNVNNWTIMEDERSMDPVAMFNLSHLQAGDYIKVGVFSDATSELAMKLKRVDAP